MNKRDRRQVTLVELGERIRRARAEIPRTVLSYRLGVSWSLLDKWERGLVAPKLVDLLELCRVLDRPAAFFLDGVEGPTLESTLLDMGFVSERNLLKAKARLFRQIHGWEDGEQPTEPSWRQRAMGERDLTTY